MWRARDELMSLQQLVKQHGVTVDGVAVETLLCRVSAEPRSNMVAPASPATCAAAETMGAIPSPSSSTYTGPLYTGASPHHRAQSEETSGGGGAGGAPAASPTKNDSSMQGATPPTEAVDANKPHIPI
jgi:hypothetical protein